MTKQLKRQAFGRLLYTHMLRRGWNQSELARQANLPRDSISTYVRGIALPTEKSLKSLADVLGLTPADLLPDARGSNMDDDSPSFEMRVSPGAPLAAWLRVNRLVSLSTATKIAELIESDRIANSAPAN